MNCLMLATELSAQIPNSKVVLGYFNQNGYYLEDEGEFHAWIEYDKNGDTYVLDPTIKLHDKKLNVNYVAFEEFEEFGMIVEPNIYKYGNKFYFKRKINYRQYTEIFDTLKDAKKYKTEFIEKHCLRGDKPVEFTVERMKELVEYIPETGDFISKVNGYKKIKGESCVKQGKKGYKYFGLDGIGKHAHVFAYFYMNGTWPTGEIDHIDLDKGNNAWDNLREVSQSINSHNTDNNATNTSGVKGVYIIGKSSFVAKIYVDHKPIHLGSFADFDDAVRARYDAEVKYNVLTDNSPALNYLKEKGLI